MSELLSFRRLINAGSSILSNIGWLTLDQMIRLGLGLFVGVWTARYLGPSQFGLLSYAIAFVGLTGSLATLGLQSVVVRHLVLGSSAPGSILASAAALQFGASIISCLITLIIIHLVGASSVDAIALVTIAALSLPFQFPNVVRYWCEANTISRYIVWVDSSVFIIVSGLRIGLIVIGAPVSFFAWLLVVHAILAALALSFVYMILIARRPIDRPTFTICKSLLRQSWPLALSGVAIIVYTRTDQLMLEALHGSNSVGVYAASLRLAEVWYTLPVIVTASLFPSILNVRNQSQVEYKQRLERLMRILIALAFFGAVVMTFASTPLTKIVFGGNYTDSGNILRIQIWSGLFVFIGVSSGSWLVAEGLQLHALYRTICGALLNIAGNFVLIPPYGALGAAWATLLSQIAATYLMDAMSVSTRPMFIMKTRALMFWRGWPAQEGLP
jgi:O-antigen/teichoic acid export membrane protein